MFVRGSLGRKFGLYAGVVAVALGVLMPTAVGAQTPPARAPLNLTTSPLPLNVIAKPGQTVTADIRVKNNGTRPERLKIELLKFGASGDTGRPQIQERDAQDQYFNWVSFSETNFSADPNVWKTVKMTINTPKEAAFGYYYAVLFSRAVPDRPTGGNSAVEGGVASLVLLNVDAPGSRREAKVAEISASQKVYEFLPAKFDIKLRNSGNVHVAPVGTMFIKRGSEQVGSLSFNSAQGNILPDSNRSFEMTWDDGFPKYVTKGSGTDAQQSLEWNLGDMQKLRFGKYTATLVAVYDDGQRDIPVEAEVSFWVVPWRFIGGVLLTVLFIGFGLWAISRLLWKSIKKQAVADPGTPDSDSLAAATKSSKKKDTGTVSTKPEEEHEAAGPDRDSRPKDSEPKSPTDAPAAVTGTAPIYTRKKNKHRKPHTETSGNVRVPVEQRTVTMDDRKQESEPASSNSAGKKRKNNHKNRRHKSKNKGYRRYE